jgi:hypothetical protein
MIAFLNIIHGPDFYLKRFWKLNSAPSSSKVPTLLGPVTVLVHIIRY